MLITSQTTTLLQIFCELLLHSLVIFKSMKVADDISKSNSECKWVNEYVDHKQSHVVDHVLVTPFACSGHAASNNLEPSSSDTALLDSYIKRES